MKKIMAVLAVVAMVSAGCAQQPKNIYLRVDGQSGRNNPVLAQQYEVDSTMCVGERNKANLSGVTVASGGFAGLAAQIDRSNSADTVQRGCMAEKGYLLVPEDQAEAKQAELAAVAELKRKQEAPQPAAVARRR
jgi:hypothetical protein